MNALIALLDELRIPYERYEHAPVFTCEEAERAIPRSDAVQTKNLFLRDKRGRRHLLVVTSCEKSVDVKRFADLVDADHLSFASAERLQRYLGVAPGSVTVFGLMHDPAHAVELFVDADIWSAECWRCHPLINSETLVLARVDVEKFLAHTGHVPRVVAVASRPAAS
jgi:Ala-tRNA(Pro) deacylase